MPISPIITRCSWVSDDPIYQAYHDEEWGVPVHDDRLLFEYLILEGAQAGLSWLTVLKRREGYRACFDQFNAEKIARYTEKKCEKLCEDARIIRHRLKIDSTVTNAKAFLSIQEKFPSFDAYLWQFVDGEPIVNRWKSPSQMPARTAISDAMSKDLKKRGFKFVGSTICYAFMQAVGMVNDHQKKCFRCGVID